MKCNTYLINTIKDLWPSYLNTIKDLWRSYRDVLVKGFWLFIEYTSPIWYSKKDSGTEFRVGFECFSTFVKMNKKNKVFCLTLELPLFVIRAWSDGELSIIIAGLVITVWDLDIEDGIEYDFDILSHIEVILLRVLTPVLNLLGVALLTVLDLLYITLLTALFLIVDIVLLTVSLFIVDVAISIFDMVGVVYNNFPRFSKSKAKPSSSASFNDEASPVNDLGESKAGSNDTAEPTPS